MPVDQRQGMTEGFECKRSRRSQQYDLSESQASSRRLPRQTSRLLTASLSLTTRLTYGEVQQGLQTSHSRCTFSKAAGYKRFDCFILGHGSHANATCLPKTILIGSYSSHERAQDSLERFPNLLLRTFKKKRNRTEGLGSVLSHQASFCKERARGKGVALLRNISSEDRRMLAAPAYLL
jgi:hypothetical protein